jgi:glycosyltransferase involved in cell wall biosynthesis
MSIPKIKVAYVIGGLADGGAERQLLELLRHHDRNRFEPYLILMEGINLDRAAGLVNDSFVMRIPHAGNAHWRTRVHQYVLAIQRTARQLRRWRIQVVHAQLPAACILAGFAARSAHIPVFIANRLSMMGLYRKKTRVGAWLDQLTIRLADFNLGNSEAVTRELMFEGKCPPEKCGTIHNGVDISRFHPAHPRTFRSIAGWSDDHVVFGMVANFSPVKRHVDFVHSAEIIARSHPEARFLMVGADYGQRSHVCREIEQRGLTSIFYVADSTPNPADIFSALDVYMSASLSEGFSNVVLEAMASGKPVIATDTGGNPEAVVHGETGLLVPVGSPSSIAQASRQLLQNPVLRQQMGRKGRARVEENFSLDAMARKNEQLYLNLLHAS